MKFKYKSHTIEIKENTNTSWIITFDNDKLKFLVKGRTKQTWTIPDVKKYILGAIEFAKQVVINKYKHLVIDEVLDIIQWLNLDEETERFTLNLEKRTEKKNGKN